MTDAKLLSAEMVDIQGVPTARILLSYVFSRDNIQCYKAYYYYYLSDGGHFMCILYDSTGDGSWLDAFDESAQSIRFINP